MEDLIVPLLFVYFFVIRPILKRVRKAEAAKGAPRRPAWLLLWEKVQEELRKAAEQGRQGAGGGPGEAPERSWEDLFPPSEAPGPEEARITRKPRPAPPREPAVAEAPPEPAPAPHAARPARAGFSLRRAVAWSEILAPPVALRDPEGTDSHGVYRS